MQIQAFGDKRAKRGSLTSAPLPPAREEDTEGKQLVHFLKASGDGWYTRTYITPLRVCWQTIWATQQEGGCRNAAVQRPYRPDVCLSFTTCLNHKGESCRSTGKRIGSPIVRHQSLSLKSVPVCPLDSRVGQEGLRPTNKGYENARRHYIADHNL